MKNNLFRVALAWFGYFFNLSQKKKQMSFMTSCMSTFSPCFIQVEVDPSGPEESLGKTLESGTPNPMAPPNKNLRGSGNPKKPLLFLMQKSGRRYSATIFFSPKVIGLVSLTKRHGFLIPIILPCHHRRLRVPKSKISDSRTSWNHQRFRTGE